MRLMSLIAGLAGLVAATGCSLYFETGDSGREPEPGPLPEPDPCLIAGQGSGAPGAPFDFGEFRSEVWPTLQLGCAFEGCHAAGAGVGSFTVWPSDDALCPDVRSFNQLYQRADLASPGQSPILLAIEGLTVPHPIRYLSGDLVYDMLVDYITGAVATPPLAADYLDFDYFNVAIQPMLDEALCSSQGCHTLERSPGGFGLSAYPEPYSDPMWQNFLTVAGYVDLGTISSAEETRFYARATDRHAGFAVEDPETLAEWIRSAAAPW